MMTAMKKNRGGGGKLTGADRRSTAWTKCKARGPFIGATPGVVGMHGVAASTQARMGSASVHAWRRAQWGSYGRDLRATDVGENLSVRRWQGGEMDRRDNVAMRHA
jgi:hypothetical protein